LPASPSASNPFVAGAPARRGSFVGGITRTSREDLPGRRGLEQPGVGTTWRAIFRLLQTRISSLSVPTTMRESI